MNTGIKIYFTDDYGPVDKSRPVWKLYHYDEDNEMLIHLTEYAKLSDDFSRYISKPVGKGKKTPDLDVTQLDARNAIVLKCQFVDSNGNKVHKRCTEIFRAPKKFEVLSFYFYVLSNHSGCCIRVIFSFMLSLLVN